MPTICYDIIVYVMYYVLVCSYMLHIMLFSSYVCNWYVAFYVYDDILLLKLISVDVPHGLVLWWTMLDYIITHYDIL